MKLIFKFIIGAFLLVNFMIFGFLLYPIPQELETLKPVENIKIVDRYNQLLYETLVEDKGRQTFIAFEQIPDEVKQAFIAIEDQRFYEHNGVDIKAILRAIWQNTSAGKVVSGGSTITQQVVRNMVGINKKRTVPQKIKESILAIKISRQFSKDHIFEKYLNSIYFGGLAYGVEAASWQYFNKSIINVDLAEAAFLAGLPQSPNRYYPYRHFERAKKRQKEVLNAMGSLGFINNEEKTQSTKEIIQLKTNVGQKKAPHFVDFILSKNEEGNELKTTLDLGLQNRIENILFSDLSFLRSFNIKNAAAIVLNAKTGEILAMVGSIDYEDETIDGAVNVTDSLRQPGSSIKPLIYALALEKGWNPQTIIVDEPIRFETEDGLPYQPKNFDLKYHGKVTFSEALAQSLNIPAVKTLDFIGVNYFLNRVKDFGINTLNQPANHYGLSLALGSGEVKLMELANAYSSFANGGKRPELKYLKDQSTKLIPVIKPEIADQISSILSNNKLRTPAFGEENPLNLSFKVAAKTGTTRQFKDNWVLGYTDDFVVGVWVGNSQGEVMQGASGITGAGPLFYKIMNLLHEMTNTKLTLKTPHTTHSSTYEEKMQIDEEEFRILSPFANDVFLFDSTKPSGFQRIQLKATHKAKWYVNDQFIEESKQTLWPLSRGLQKIKAVLEGETRVVNIEVK